MDKSNIKIVAVVGETASGKSDLALEIARRYDGELICADSRTIYKKMDIGTAKPDLVEQKQVPHHGLDLVGPDERYTAAQFKHYAQEVIEDINSRGKLPIIVGGTGLYVDAVLYDYSFGGDLNQKERSNLNNKNVVELTTLANEKGIEVDSALASNKRHLIRTIERGGLAENNNVLAYDALVLGLSLSKTQLRKRVEARVERMFKIGLRKEYNDLRTIYDPNSEAFTGIGYREFLKWEAGEASMSEVKREIVKNTMNLAKRQRTWFKRRTNIEWAESQEHALVLVESFMDNK